MESTQPTNYIEAKIKLLLCLNGYKQRDIEFKKNNGSQGRYLRVGYWSFIDDEILWSIQNNTGITLTPESFWEDDCGWQTKYLINRARRKGEGNYA